MEMIGNKKLKAEVQKITSKAKIYRECDIIPSFMMINLDAGEGRTTVLEHISEAFYNNGVISFSSSPDKFLEIKFDGTAEQFKKCIKAIDNAAVYSNHYSNILAIDCIKLAGHHNERHYKEFFELLMSIQENAYIIIFIPQSLNNNEKIFTEKLRKTLKSIKTVRCEPYTHDEVAEIMKREIEKHNIHIEAPVSAYIDFIVNKNNIQVKDIKKITSELLIEATVCTNDRKLQLDEKLMNEYVTDFIERVR